MNPIIRKSFAGAVFALGLVGAPFAGAGLALLSPGLAHAETAPTLETMKQTLGQYGQFVSHEKYGEVWKPTVTPRGWHPYPACDWVFTKQFGWYLADKTPWGAIVHHYGRWINEGDGWLWVPGLEFSPGWVAWRTSDEWIGWAPTPPDGELTPEKIEAFNDDKLWTFMDAKKFGSTCDGGATSAQYAEIYAGTRFVTDIRLVGGVGVFVLPPKFKAPPVNIDINIFAPWSPTFIGTWISSWTNIFNDVDITVVVNECRPGDPKQPRDPQQPNDPQDPRDPVNPKPRSKQIGDAPPAGPNGFTGFRPRQPERIQNPGGQRQPGERMVKTFEPQPDDVVEGGREPGGRKPATLRDPRRDFGDRAHVQREPGAGKPPLAKFRRDAGPSERQPMSFSHRQPRDVGLTFERAELGHGRGFDGPQRFERNGGGRMDGGFRSFRGGFGDRQ